MCYCCGFFFFSSRRRHTRCALVTGVQTCALPISCILTLTIIHSSRTTDGFRPIRIVVDGGTLQARIEQLVSVSSTRYRASTSDLSTWWSSPALRKLILREASRLDAFSGCQIGRAPVRTPVTNAHLVCHILLEKKND